MTSERRVEILRELAERRDRREHGQGRQFTDVSVDEWRRSAHAAMVLAEADVASTTSPLLATA